MSSVVRISSHSRHPRKRRFSALVTLCCLALTGYFAHHAMYGRFGLEQNRSLSASSKALAGRLADLKVENAELARDVELLRGKPHPDMIEEASRRLLGYGYPDTRILTMTR